MGACFIFCWSCHWIINIGERCRVLNEQGRLDLSLRQICPILGIMMWVLVGGRGHLLEQILKILDVCFYPYSRKLRFWHLPGVGTFSQGFESEACDIHIESILWFGLGILEIFNIGNQGQKQWQCHWGEEQETSPHMSLWHNPAWILTSLFLLVSVSFLTLIFLHSHQPYQTCKILFEF